MAVIIMMTITVSAAKDPEVLFDVKVDKPVSNIYLIGEKEDIALCTNKARMFVYNTSTGKLLWDTKVEGYDEAGMDLIWNDQYYIVSLKKGMRCYDIPTGKVVWETQTPLKMKEYSGYANFSTGFVMNFGGVLMGFNPNNGTVKWTSEQLAFSGKLKESDISNFYSYNFEWGGRLAALGDKITQLVDASTGKTMATYEMKYSDKNAEAVRRFGDDMLLLLGSSSTRCINLRDGKEMWFVEENVDPNRSFATIEYNHGFYGLFAFRNKMMLMDLHSGKILWEKGKDEAAELENVHLYPGGLLMVTVIKNVTLADKNKSEKNNGSYTRALGIDLLSGNIKYQTNIGYTDGQTMYVKIPFIGEVGYRSSICHVMPDYNYGALFYFFSRQANKLGKPGEKFKDPGGEGFTLMDPMTGEVKWRNEFVLFSNWAKPIEKAGAYKNVNAINAMDMPNYITPEYKISGDYGYINADGKLKKIDLKTGKAVWESPEYGYVQKFMVSEGRVFGNIGFTRWRMGSDVNKLKGWDMIDRSPEVGYFVLDDASGKELWNAGKIKDPFNTFAEHYTPGKGKVVLCDGKYLRCLNIIAGKYDWEIDMKKQLTGAIGGEDGITFVLTGVKSDFSAGYGYYTITTTKTFNVSMEHGVFPQPEGNYLVLSTAGPAMVNLEGKIVWKGEWEWKNSKISFVPQVTPNGIIYQYKKMFTYFSLKDGQPIWESKEKRAEDIDVFLDSAKSRIFFVDNKQVTAYKL